MEAMSPPPPPQRGVWKRLSGKLSGDSCTGWELNKKVMPLWDAHCAVVLCPPSLLPGTRSAM